MSPASKPLPVETTCHPILERNPLDVGDDMVGTCDTWAMTGPYPIEPASTP